MVTSPYSRYGYGLLNDHMPPRCNAQWGGGYHAMNSGRQINVMNPASYAAIDSLTFLFDIGMDMSLQWNREGSKYRRDFGGGLDYITMQVPITKYLGASARPVAVFISRIRIRRRDRQRHRDPRRLRRPQPAISRPQRKDSERAHGRRKHIIPVGRNDQHRFRHNRPGSYRRDNSPWADTSM